MLFHDFFRNDLLRDLLFFFFVDHEKNPPIRLTSPSSAVAVAVASQVDHCDARGVAEPATLGIVHHRWGKMTQQLVGVSYQPAIFDREVL